MRVIYLDAGELSDRKKAHQYLAEQLEFPDYYGCNLDALYDCLTELSECQIIFENEESAGRYYKTIRKVFSEAAKENNGLKIHSK